MAILWLLFFSLSGFSEQDCRSDMVEKLIYHIPKAALTISILTVHKTKWAILYQVEEEKSNIR